MKVSSQFESLGTYGALDADRGGFQQRFVDLVMPDARLAQRVLDVGCGGRFPPELTQLRSAIHALDGVDPNPAVLRHDGLMNRWKGRLEDNPVPAATYDLILSYNVVEHVDNPGRFLNAVGCALKPGGVFWFLTPHARHPFAWAVRLVQGSGLRRFWRRNLHGEHGQTIVNDYPAYYRMNSARAIRHWTDEQMFASVCFHYLPCMQWDTYFPVRLRWLPHLYDRVLGTRFAAGSLLLACRMTKRSDLKEP